MIDENDAWKLYEWWMGSPENMIVIHYKEQDRLAGLVNTVNGIYASFDCIREACPLTDVLSRNVYPAKSIRLGEIL